MASKKFQDAFRAAYEYDSDAERLLVESLNEEIQKLRDGIPPKPKKAVREAAESAIRKLQEARPQQHLNIEKGLAAARLLMDDEESFLEEKAGFLKAVEINQADGIAWKLDRMVAAQTTHRVGLKFAAMVADATSIYQVAAAYKDLLEWCKRECASLRASFSSMAHNAVALASHKAMQGILDSARYEWKLERLISDTEAELVRRGMGN